MSGYPSLIRELQKRRPVASNGHNPKGADQWETELVVLRGDDREHLRRRTLALADFARREPRVSLKDLAFTFNTDLAPGGSRLAVVAGSADELHDRLNRAGERLADPKCRQIRDSQGIYFFEQPLHPEGKLAFLFPGEGAQYLNMLADLLPYFPEVREHFALCDRLLLDAGFRDRPLSEAILLPVDATPEQQAAAETELWRLGTAVCSVLCAEWALYMLLLRLGLKPDALAGHSSGELTALAAAGCLEAHEQSFTQMFSVFHLLQQQEDEAHVAEAILLAVGAGRKTVSEVIAQAAGPVFIAMDNCPHQTVLAGPPEPMIAVEAQLKARGVVCERLPFHRPYHTPLFEPLLGPIAAMYRKVSVHPPRTPVYSCVTGKPFPPDGAEVERLAVVHWASAVQFTGIIESMYADGVRLFVEAGPRGNLTSFVEDILRGKPCAAVASNLQRRSGLTQLNHMAGQLLAHHVPLRMEHFYARRNPRRIAWEAEAQRVTVGVAAAEAQPQAAPLAEVPGIMVNGAEHATELVTWPQGPSDRVALMEQYWGVMEQFLEVQRELMECFLNGRAGEVSPLGEHLAQGADALPLPGSPAWPLLGEIVHHVPGRELVMRRRMDLNEDLYAQDHTLGGLNASAVDPRHSGLPVMPMAFSMEMMAEVAGVMFPGKILVGMKRVRLQRWIPFDEQEPIILELTAKVLPGEPLQIAMTIHDRGNSIRPGVAESPVVEGTMVLADAYPEPPPVDDWPLTNERPPKYTRGQLYEEERRLFHGPIFQAVHSTDREGDEGIEGHLRTLPFTGLFRSTPRPDLITDPLLIDSSTHLLGCWHLGVPDQSGRVVFPYELGNVTFYQPRPAEGSLVKCRVKVGATSARRVSHQIDLVGPDGRWWCRIAPAEYWRFYLPPNFVDFYRRHNQFLLAEEWPLPGLNWQEVRCTRLEPLPDVLQTVWRNALAHVVLSPDEWKQFRALQVPEQRRNEWLFGRIAAKDAVRAICRDRRNEWLFPADIEIETDTHGRPLARLRGNPKSAVPMISITHTGNVAMALASFERRVGIDLERIQPRGPGFEAIAFDETERQLLGRFAGGKDEAITRFWCAKEAVAKALGRGLAEGPRSVAVRGVDESGVVQVALGPLLADAYPELRMDLLLARTVRQGDWIVATTTCERAVS